MIYDLLMWKFKGQGDVLFEIEGIRERHGVLSFDNRGTWYVEKELEKLAWYEMNRFFKFTCRLFRADKPHKHLMEAWDYLLEMKEKSA